MYRGGGRQLPKYFYRRPGPHKYAVPARAFARRFGGATTAHRGQGLRVRESAGPRADASSGRKPPLSHSALRRDCHASLARSSWNVAVAVAAHRRWPSHCAAGGRARAEHRFGRAQVADRPAQPAAAAAAAGDPADEAAPRCDGEAGGRRTSRAALCGTADAGRRHRAADSCGTSQAALRAGRPRRIGARGLHQPRQRQLAQARCRRASRHARRREAHRHAGALCDVGDSGQGRSVLQLGLALDAVRQAKHRAHGLRARDAVRHGQGRLQEQFLRVRFVGHEVTTCSISTASSTPRTTRSSPAITFPRSPTSTRSRTRSITKDRTRSRSSTLRSCATRRSSRSPIPAH